MKIYKITADALSDIERKTGVIAVSPTLGSKLCAGEYFELIAPFYNETTKILTPGELGCTLSHIAIYRKIVEENESAIILEHDIVPTEKELAQARDIFSDCSFDFVHLGWHPNVAQDLYFKGRPFLDDGFYEVDPTINFYGTFSYYLTPRMASELLGFHRKVLRRADAWNIFFKYSSIKPYFYGVFHHPVDRAAISRERGALKNKTLAALVFKKMNTQLWLINRAIFRALKSYRSIKPLEKS